MTVDIQQLQAIHHLQGEVSEADREVKTSLRTTSSSWPICPSNKPSDEAEQALKEARDRLKITIATDPDLAKLADRIDEAKFHRRDLGEILSHHLVAYHEETGRDVIRDMETRNRKIEFKARLGKPALDQPRLPLGINRHLGQHFPIPVGMKVEVKPEEGE